MNADQTVTAFCQALTKGDIDSAMKLVAEDCVYHNIPLDPINGAAGIKQALQGFMQMLGSIEIETKVQVAVGDTVMNERIDSFTPPGKSKYGLPVAGVFVVKNGKITAWRDYFDVRQFTKGTGIEM
jgi:limonene-1,2-epoxide hydrolase